MKRQILLVLLVLVVSVLFFSIVPFANAQEEGAVGGIASGVTNLVNGFIEVFQPISRQVLGDTPSGDLLFAKVLFFIIILGIVWVALERVDFFSEKTWVLAVVSIAVSILATRFIVSEQLIQAVLLPYSTLGIAIAAGLPFVVWFLLINVGFSQPGQKPIRRIAWIFFAIVFFFVWSTRRADLIVNNSSAGAIYIWTIVAAIIVMLLDGTINKFFINLKIEKQTGTNAGRLVTIEKRRIGQATQDFADGYIDAAERDKRIKESKKKIAALHK